MRKIIGILFFLMFILNTCISYADTGRVVMLSEPATGHIFTQTDRPLFSWEAVSGALSYQIQVAELGSFSPAALVLDEEAVESTSFRMPSELTVKRIDEGYYWRVRAVVREDGSRRLCPWSQVRNFMVWPTPKPRELVSPPNDCHTGSLRPQFSWRNPSHYGEHEDKIQLSTDSHFSRIVFEEVVTAGEAGGLLSPEFLEYGRSYYWRVRFEDWLRQVEGLTPPGPWSEVGSFETFLSLPPKVFLISPRHDAYVSSPATFSWNEVPAATSYNLVFSDNRDFSSLTLRLFPESNSITTPLSFEDGSYYWRVRARNDSGWGEWSDSWCVIKTSEPLEPDTTPWPEAEEDPECSFRPELLSPIGPISTDRPEFSWRGFAETPGRNPRYRIQVSTDPDFTHLAVDTRPWETTLSCPVALTSGYVYYWRVRARERSDRGWCPWSAAESFSLSLTRVPVTLITPEDNAALKTTRPSFSWEANLPYGYQGEFELEVSDRRTFFTSVVRTTVRPSGSGGSILCPGNLSDGTYYWHVRQKVTDDSGWGEWCRAKSFKVDVSGPQIRILSPTERRISTSTIPTRTVVSCEVTDNVTGVDRVEFYLRGRRVAHRTRPHHGSVYTADISGLNEGRNTITIKAYDKSGSSGNMSQASLPLEVERVLGLQQRPPILPEKFQTPKPGVPTQRLPRR